MTDLTRADLAAMIDHTILKPEASREQVLAVAEEGRANGVASVCVNPVWIPTVVEALAGSGVKACSVVGFPLGATTAAAVAQEARGAIADGAEEIDMVAPLGLVQSGDWDAVRSYIGEVREATAGTVLKVILETATLSDEQIVELCRISDEVGADFVKTSTGFHAGGGASVHAVELMRANVSDRVGVKASGGIRDLATVRAMVDAGANRLGLSGTAAILAELD